MCSYDIVIETDSTLVKYAYCTYRLGGKLLESMHV